MSKIGQILGAMLMSFILAIIILWPVRMYNICRAKGGNIVTCAFMAALLR